MMEMGWTYSENEGQQIDQAVHRMTGGTRSRRRPSRRRQDDIAQKEGTTWSRTALNRRQWRALMKGYLLQWMDNAYVKIEVKGNVTKGNTGERSCLTELGYYDNLLLLATR